MSNGIDWGHLSKDELTLVLAQTVSNLQAGQAETKILVSAMHSDVSQKLDNLNNCFADTRLKCEGRFAPLEERYKALATANSPNRVIQLAVPGGTAAVVAGIIIALVQLFGG